MLSPLKTTLFTLLLAFTCAAGSKASAQTKARLAPITFNGVEYFHRSSEDEQHNFSPHGQDDLRHATEIFTLFDYADVVDSAGVAKYATDTVEFYKGRGGRVVTHITLPRTAEKPAEHLITVILESGENVDAMFLRFTMAGGIGIAPVYTRHIHGQSAEKAMSEWMEKNGAATEKALLSWEIIPLPAAVKKTNAGAATASTEKAAPKLASFKFHGAEYVHRWSQDNQHEFTPHGQEDLQKWTDMITLHRYPDAVDGDGLAATANAVLENYKKHEAIVVTVSSVPRTAEKPAEHLITVMLGSREFLEAVFVRFKLAGGAGTATIYSHRIYGPAGKPMSAWLEKNGAAVEKALMGWENIPAPAAAKK